jgi:hypothetical protein
MELEMNITDETHADQVLMLKCLESMTALHCGFVEPKLSTIIIVHPLLCCMQTELCRIFIFLIKNRVGPDDNKEQ